ncbi:MAG: acyl-CoA dehydrogenase family protein [Solirubrobacteraceae bacterium]|nr:acyl-CoA dehydrogenase family protein [Solirubrobacteraceae bacterium]
MASTDTTTSIDPRLTELPRLALNQAPPLIPANFAELDLPLREALEREGAAWAMDDLLALGATAGSVEAAEHAWRAEHHEPILRTHDRYGRRIDEVQLDPSWHWLLDGGISNGLAASPWRDPGPGAHVARAAKFMTWGQANAGVMCPISMTYAAVPALRDGAPDLAATWEPRLTSLDPAESAVAGMAMTERQGGSDVRANRTRAVDHGGGEYELWGHKWFCSYPPCDIFLVLAQTTDDPGAPSCFLVERGPGMEFQRLKDKLGTRSLASSEVEFRGIRARLIGEEGRGVPAIVRMVNHTRLDCTLGAASTMRRGTLEAIHHATHREAFGGRLVDLPAMRNVLADLALESEAATATALRLARTYDDDTPVLRRIATAIEKYWISKRAAAHAAEALECLGGNGYVEESGMPLLYRDAPLNGIWEGSGNVAALDVLRAITKETHALPAFLAECELARGADRRFDAHLDATVARAAGLLTGNGDGDAAAAIFAAQFGARRLVEDLAVAFQGSLLVRHAPPAVADAFCAGRLDADRGRVYGTLPTGVDTAALIGRALGG